MQISHPEDGCGRDEEGSDNGKKRGEDSFVSFQRYFVVYEALPYISCVNNDFQFKMGKRVHTFHSSPSHNSTEMAVIFFSRTHSKAENKKK